jgi:histone-lysine N-methyltransferase SETMAR
VQKSAGKFLASIIWYQDGTLLNDYSSKSQTINAGYYSYLQVQLKDILKNKLNGKLTDVVLFLHDYAPTDRTLARQKKLTYQLFQCLDHTAYSPNLATSDYHLFRGLNKQLRSRHFSCEAQVIAAAET